ncbi:MAG: AtzH-like domain-containing protein [Ilumatobacteraceae bacterium]
MSDAPPGGPDDGPDDLGEVAYWSDVYEDALRRNDVHLLNGLFLDHPDVLRFGVGDEQHGYGELVAWRAGAPAVSPERRTTGRWIVALAPGAVAVDLTFADDDRSIGRQSQTWVRTDDGWRITRAHVSIIPR